MIVALVPAYNAVHTIAEVVLKTGKYVDNVIVFDDGSIDDTTLIAKGCGAKVIQNKVNHGKGYALKHLITHAKIHYGDNAVFVTLDADMQHNPDDIPKLTKPIIDKKADVVIGERRKMTKTRKAGNFILNKVSGVKVKDTQGGFRAYSKQALNKVKITTDGFGADAEILDSLKGLKVAMIPIDVKYDKYSHKKNLFAHFVEVFNFLFIQRPLLNFGVLGVTATVAGLWKIVDVVNVWNLYDELALGTFLFAMLAIILGVLFVMTGVILHLLTVLDQHSRRTNTQNSSKQMLQELK